MREILFRGKRVENNEWVEGYAYHNEQVSKIITAIGYGQESHYCEAYVVFPKTVSEFTGLRDRNGKRIFEGDILIAQADDGTVGIILLCGIGECLDLGDEDNEKIFGVYGEPTSGNGNRLIIPLSCEDFHYEVIGNKWDNPELLKGGAA